MQASAEHATLIDNTFSCWCEGCKQPETSLQASILTCQRSVFTQPIFQVVVIIKYSE
jgi:hypothetical protein